MKEFIVKVKDFHQETTHVIRQIARTKSEANAIVLAFLRDNLGYDDFEIV